MFSLKKFYKFKISVEAMQKYTLKMIFRNNLLVKLQFSKNHTIWPFICLTMRKSCVLRIVKEITLFSLFLIPYFKKLILF